MLETQEEIDRLQDLLDRSAAAAGPHMSAIIRPERRLTATQVCDRLRGLCLLTLATVTADGRPLNGPVDGFWLHGAFYFSSGTHSVRMRHLARRPAVSATYLPGAELAITVHGTARLFPTAAPEWAGLRQAMLDHYLPLQGQSFQEWLDGDSENMLGARIEADKMFTFSSDAD